jgi:hypothetical protein
MQENKLTPEIEAKIPQYVDRAIWGISDGKRYKQFVFEDAKACVDYNYKFAELDMPVVMAVENPKEAQLLFMYLAAKPELSALVDALAERSRSGEDVQSEVNSLQDIVMEAMVNDIRNDNIDWIKNSDVPSYLFTMNIYSLVYFTWYEFVKNEFGIETEKKEDLDAFSELYFKSNIYDVITADTLAIMVKFPLSISVNDSGELHRTDGSAVEWAYRYPELDWKCYFINSRSVEESKYDLALSGNLTFEQWSSEPNEDVRAAWYEILGQEKMLELLKAEEIDTATFEHANGEVETVTLYKTTFGIPELDGEPLAWVRFTCPSTGTNYLIDVEPKWNTATEAAISTSPFFGDEINDVKDYKFNKRS